MPWCSCGTHQKTPCVYLSFVFSVVIFSPAARSLVHVPTALASTIAILVRARAQQPSLLRTSSSFFTKLITQFLDWLLHSSCGVNQLLSLIPSGLLPSLCFVVHGREHQACCKPQPLVSFCEVPPRAEHLQRVLASPCGRFHVAWFALKTNGARCMLRVSVLLCMGRTGSSCWSGFATSSHARRTRTRASPWRATF